MSNLSLMRRLTLSLKAIAPGGGRRLAGRDLDGNLYFEKPDPNGGRYPRRTVELADPQLSEANYDDANIAVQWQSWLRNTRQSPPTQAEIQRDEARKKLTIARAKALDQAWLDRKEELQLEQAQDRQTILGIAAASRGVGSQIQDANTSTSSTSSPSSFVSELPPQDEATKSEARKQVEEREAARKSGFKPTVQQGDTFQPQAWAPTAARRR
ncbi:hypothetical protein BX616_007613 [Lobosporangium transversale]|uniref:NADH dehydrogenase [ubiquinone] 1 alpha subcomplex subunit n=1 Tax=Lobosporangium transversale TaxID=64571 RepID=A0A1Y2G956_9FUNG|nr:hypothetical protein BCR41DRAFT_363746 [Lobosporangium transversale]KAF9914765.1 hypothetical protein BX616_007613 [Lobosporangium transversale]ORY99800.1 hypothetical protein BCR41DRAFT_363746 [Lobosporangium transversale]|eukprot:XP_021876034.1 hypothetical protein BCR41DRAFT_363746 [Lobosporangium transversale]